MQQLDQVDINFAVNSANIHNLHLRNRFHFAVHLFSDRSMVISKCGKNKKGSTQGDSQVANSQTNHTRFCLF